MQRAFLILLAGLLGPACFVKGTAEARPFDLDARLGHPVLEAGDGDRRRVYLRVALDGIERQSERRRPPINVALVIDKSGSMSGDKIRYARRAARLALDRLGADDIVSVVAYDDGVRVLVPATRISDRAAIERGIARLGAGGRTALFAGVVKGADEVRKFIRENQVNRVVLVSDGIANVGPSTPSELASLGGSLLDSGISVTTIGLGLDYNEDLMTRLAAASDGNNAFAETPEDLVRFFDLEFGSLTRIVAQRVTVRIDCAPGVRPVRVLGRSAEIVGTRVTVDVNQLYAGHRRTVVLELELPAEAAGTERSVAAVDVGYDDTVGELSDRVRREVGVSFVRGRAEVERRADRDVGIRVVELLSSEQTDLAIQLRDQGRIQEAERTVDRNADFLLQNARRYRAPALEKQSIEQRRLKPKIKKKKDWNRSRKKMNDMKLDLDLEGSF
jgi:Ca-activated chloride channel family protein